MPRRKKDTSLATMQQQIEDLLKKPGLTPSERLKAIEVGAKLLMIRHKIEDGLGGEGSFFAKGKR
jgi:hypothetical protein